MKKSIIAIFLLGMLFTFPLAIAQSSVASYIPESDVALASSMASNNPPITDPTIVETSAIVKDESIRTPSPIVVSSVVTKTESSIVRKSPVIKNRKKQTSGIDWCERADMDEDFQVNPVDSALVRNMWGERNCSEENDWCLRGDVNRSGKVSIMDSFRVYWKRGCSY